MKFLIAFETLQTGVEEGWDLYFNAFILLLFFYLLRFDKVLKIQAHYLKVVNEVRGEIKLSLPFRKTHKYGGMFISSDAFLTL